MPDLYRLTAKIDAEPEAFEALGTLALKNGYADTETLLADRDFRARVRLLPDGRGHLLASATEFDAWLKTKRRRAAR
jgi:hypothetical protein